MRSASSKRIRRVGFSLFVVVGTLGRLVIMNVGNNLAVSKRNCRTDDQ
jgi:hypothetical protein